ncbi:MAG: outer membrane protein assembly factor BamD [Gemmatimonadetes bacterium]|nr:outer membrane protein assembly factor BamD [Gemmatimonadota bacterium]
MTPRFRPVRPRRAPLALVLLATALAAAGCFKGFDPRVFRTSESLFGASMDQLKRGRLENATKGFEKLTLDLPARDPLLPVAFWYLAVTYDRREDYLFAAQNYQRLAETFPDDSLADDALFAAGKSYAAMWRTPELDPQYALLAQGTWRGLLANYPETSLRDSVTKAIGRIEDKLATKDYETGQHYLRRKAYDSAIIYFKDVMKTYPATPHARLSGLRLLSAYRAIKYGEEAKELCETLNKSYPQDGDVKTACAPPAATAAR